MLNSQPKKSLIIYKNVVVISKKVRTISDHKEVKQKVARLVSTSHFIFLDIS